MVTLTTYRAKRRFGITQEPKGRVARKRGNVFVVQKHAARRLHYDLRLELDGVMKSWAITRGPSLVPGEKRLAVQVEDHPIDYNKFEGSIPEGEYGAGTVMIWDRGTWMPQADPHEGLKKGHLTFTLSGKKLQGGWHLVRMRHHRNEKRDNWLLIKQHDAAGRRSGDRDILEEMPFSIATGRSLNEIAEGNAIKNRTKQGLATSTKAETPATHKRASAVSTRNELIAEAPKDALPSFVTPCSATLAKNPPDGEAWLHEIKFDGYRLQMRLANKSVQVLTRRGLDWTDKFPSLAAAIAKLPAKAALVDGEAVVEDINSVSSFSLLQQALKAGDQQRIIFYAFDLLHLDGRNLQSLPLIKRKDVLAQLSSNIPKHGTVRLSQSIVGPGPVLLKKACDLGLEGLVSKRASAPYVSGRGHDWIKTKCFDRQEFVVTGFVPSSVDAHAIGSLVLGFYDKGKMHYAGRTGTGFSSDVARALYRKLKPHSVKKSPFDPLPPEERGARSPIWVKPQMVVEVDFRGWTHGQRVRQASFQGIREDKLATEVVSEVRDMRNATRMASRVKLTNPDRVYWHDSKITKQALVDYYTHVWPWIKPHIIRRPIALLRCPEGVGKSDCFFQKHATAGLSGEHLLLVAEKGGSIISVKDLDGLISLVQAGALEIHIRGTTIDHREEADRLVFDLDPGPGVPWEDVIAAARDLRASLESIKLKSFVKTSGGKGLHVVVPIAFAPWSEAKAFARTVVQVMEANAPNRYISSAKKAKRDNRIFIDYLRNSREATAIAPYSTRARPTAPVAAPLDWSELSSLKSANHYTIINIPKRLERLRKDPWAEVGSLKQSLPRFT